MLSDWISRNIGENVFRNLTLVPPVLPRLIACASQPDGKMTSFPLHFSDLTIYCNCAAMWKGYAMGNNGKELYWILINFSQKGLKAWNKQNFWGFFSVKDQNLFHGVDTIGNIFTSCAHWKCGQCRSEIRLHVHCSLILIYTVHKSFLCYPQYWKS